MEHLAERKRPVKLPASNPALGAGLLAVDIGNTSIALAVVRRGRVGREGRIRTALAPTEIERRLAKFLVAARKDFPDVRRAVVCSVVPCATAVVKKILAQAGLRVQVLGRDIKVPIRNLYAKPRQVGQDRLLAAFAAKKLYGPPAVIVDLGTAVTFDAISTDGDYLGGLIVPGLELSAQALHQGTALLPRVKLQHPRTLIGKDTEGSILGGLFYGYGCLINGVVDLIVKESGRPARIVITGGHAGSIFPYLRLPRAILDPQLLFKGMSLLLEV